MQEIQQRNWLLENGVFELIELIRVKDATKFFQIPTDTIAAQIDSKGRIVYPSSQTARPKSIATERGKTKSPETTRTNRSPPAVDRQQSKRRPSGGETSRSFGLPPLNPAVAAAKPPPAPNKQSQSRTKLPKLNAKKSSLSKESKYAPTSLPPLSARSNSSTLSGDLVSRKSSIVSVDGREDPNTVLVPDYGFLVVQLEKAIIEWKRLYSKRILQVIVTWLRSQVDQMRYSVVPPANHKAAVVQQHHQALFVLQSYLNNTTVIELNPSLDEIQEIIHNAGKIMLCVAKGNVIDKKKLDYLMFVLCCVLL